MATYPSDATAPITAFPITSTVKYTSTATETDFNLPTTVAHAGEVAAFIDGILQQTSTYSISNSGATVTFTTPPSASNLTLQTVSIPPVLKQLRSSYSSLVSEFSNTSANSNQR